MQSKVIQVSSQQYLYRNALVVNCRFYFVEATLENNIQYLYVFSRLLLCGLCCLFCLCLYYFLLSSKSRWYIIIFIFDLFTTFLLPHHKFSPCFVPGVCHAEPLRPQMVQVYLARLPAAVRQALKLLIQKFNIQGFYLQKINSLVYNSRSQIFSDQCHRLNRRQRQFLIPSLVIHLFI